jgi:hypothetical protein
MEPSDAPDDYNCHCGNVRTGGCVGGFMKFQCAATSDDCTHDQYFYPSELKEIHGYSCRLCDSEAAGVVTLDEIDGMSRRNKFPLSVLVSMSAAVLIVTVSMIGVFVYKRQRTSKSVKDVDQTEESADEMNDIDNVGKDLTVNDISEAHQRGATSEGPTIPRLHDRHSCSNRLHESTGADQPPRKANTMEVLHYIQLRRSASKINNIKLRSRETNFALALTRASPYEDSVPPFNGDFGCRPFGLGVSTGRTVFHH